MIFARPNLNFEQDGGGLLLTSPWCSDLSSSCRASTLAKAVLCQYLLRLWVPKSYHVGSLGCSSAPIISFALSHIALSCHDRNSFIPISFIFTRNTTTGMAGFGLWGSIIFTKVKDSSPTKFDFSNDLVIVFQYPKLILANCISHKEMLPKGHCLELIGLDIWLRDDSFRQRVRYKSRIWLFWIALLESRQKNMDMNRIHWWQRSYDNV